jgi:hypothetical protein
MKQYAVIHAVAGLFEGYSDTTCEFFPKRGFAEKHINQILDDYRKDEMCVSIQDVRGDLLDPSVLSGADVTMTRDYENYAACVPSDMSHDDYVAEHGDDVSVEVFRIIEIDCERYNNAPSTEHMWLTWNQIESTQAWDYQPLCMSLVARVSSDVHDNATGDAAMYYAFTQLNEFISDVYYRNHAFIDVDDYVLHAFRIPKPKNNDEETTA